MLLPCWASLSWFFLVHYLTTTKKHYWLSFVRVFTPSLCWPRMHKLDNEVEHWAVFRRRHFPLKKFFAIRFWSSLGMCNVQIKTGYKCSKPFSCFFWKYLKKVTTIKQQTSVVAIFVKNVLWVLNNKHRFEPFIRPDANLVNKSKNRNRWTRIPFEPTFVVKNSS